MTDPGEVVSGIFAIVVSLFLMVIFYRAAKGGNISGLTSMFADFMPAFLVFLVILFFAVWIAQALT